MADPTGYTVSYSFSGFQGNNPTTPLPAGPLDNELANAATAIAAIAAAIKDVRRSDGALQNGIVTLNSLASGLQLTIDPTNGQLVAAAVATAQAAQTAASGLATAAAASAASALAQALAAAASASGINLSLYLAKSNNLAGLGSLPTSRSNLGLGSVATFDVGALANNIVQLNGAAKIPAYDGSLLTNIDTVPIGATIWINDTVPPTGFVKENGVLLSRASFPRLWTFANASSNIVSEASWLGGSFGGFSTGDLATTFRIADARGEFIRAYDDGRGVDPGRTIWAHEADSFKSHVHPMLGLSGITAGSVNYSFGAGASGQDNVTQAVGGTETLPRNNAKLACIKAY